MWPINANSFPLTPAQSVAIKIADLWIRWRVMGLIYTLRRIRALIYDTRARWSEQCSCVLKVKSRNVEHSWPSIKLNWSTNAVDYSLEEIYYTGLIITIILSCRENLLFSRVQNKNLFPLDFFRQITTN